MSARPIANALLLLAATLLGGCATTLNINNPSWPPAPPDDVSVRPSLKQLVKQHPSLKVVLRVPNVTTNVTQAGQALAGNTGLDHAYDEIEKRLFDAGYVVRDRALLSSLIDKEGITSYKEIQTRVDTDLIIDVSNLHFNDPQDWITTQGYPGGNLAPYGYYMAEAVATVEAKFIIVETGEVGAIVTLRLPVCAYSLCDYNYFDDGMGDVSFSFAEANRATQYDQNSQTYAYLWGQGSGPGSMNQAADTIAQKIVAVLQQ
ncbi:MAG TPA: hypothetical protein VGV16_11655 [Gammaproteobacteria bacterium]|nr:hypothetical protein [Gammaproteobacteria bacterium]